MEITEDQLLIIIDAQKDFTSNRGAYAVRHPGIIHILETKNRINALLKVVPKSRVIVIYSDYEPDQFGKDVSMCIPKTEGHEIDIEITDDHVRIMKAAHSCFSSEEFSNYLENHKIKKLVLAGFLAEYCVKKTALDGLAQGYEVSIASDYIATGDDVLERKEKTLVELKEKGARII